ncbi:hypothetical protein LCM17_16220 [Cereibacter sphaeroides]|nr:hypothetical protein [Cereibacter sphaeroides]
MTDNRAKTLPPEIFPLDRRLPILVALAAVGMLVFGLLAERGVLGEPEEFVGPAFAGIGLLTAAGAMYMTTHVCAALYDNHVRIGRHEFQYSDIIAVLGGEEARPATTNMPRHKQPFLLIQTRLRPAPYWVRVGKLKGGIWNFEARLMERVNLRRAQEEASAQRAAQRPVQATPSSNT